MRSAGASERTVRLAFGLSLLATTLAVGVPQAVAASDRVSTLPLDGLLPLAGGLVGVAAGVLTWRARETGDSA